MKLLSDLEIARRIREAFRAYPATDVAIEALCHNLQNPFEGYIIVDDQDRVLFTDAIPRGASGKILRRVLKEHPPA